MSMPDFSLFYADSLSNRNKNLTAFPIFVEYGSREKNVFLRNCRMPATYLLSDEFTGQRPDSCRFGPLTKKSR